MKEKKLKKYSEKRNFKKTPEPSPVLKLSSTPKQWAKFTIQEHRAKKAGLHYDWRLEKGGVAKSFVVRKILKDNDKFLAIPVEDHPVDYMEWEGTIPDGEYGAGTVKVYTKGTWQEIKWDKEIQFDVDSPKLKGRITLFKKFGKNWMGIFKKQ